MMAGYARLLSGAAVPAQTIDVLGECHFPVLARLGEPASE
jgi:hypothetical protein